MAYNEPIAEYELTLHDYIEILRRRALLMIATFMAVILITTALALFLPPVYQSSGTILIESQQISSEFIANSATGFASERIEVIKQRVMTRENLLRIIRKYNLFPKDDGSRVTSELIEDIRERIDISLLNTDLGGRRRGRATIAFSISFEDRYAEQAYRVTNELVTLFLDENIKSRVERATETTEFLSQEAKRLKGDLEKMETLVAAYKQENKDSLPEHLSLKIDILQRSETALAELNRDYQASKNEVIRLDLELTAAMQGSNALGGLSELEKLKAAYREATVSYTDTHPTVRSLKRKIAALENLASSDSAAANSLATDSELVFKIKTLLATAKNRLASIQKQRQPLLKKITDLEKQIIKTPQVELGLASLLRDHSNAKKKYEEIQSKELGAQIAENLEGENKSERFSLIDPPLLADKPIKPNRVKIIMLGLFAALAAAIGIAVLLEMLNQRIRGKGALTMLIGQSPLVEIPYITTSDEHKKRKQLIKRIIIAAAILFAVALLVIHFAYMELDLLFFKVLARFG